MVSPSWTLDSDVTSHQTIDRLTVGHREREIDRKRRRDLDKRWVKRRSGPVPHGQSDSDMLSSPETQRFLILLATVVMNTGSDSQRHKIKVIVHPLVVLVLYTVRCRRSLFHPPRLCLAVSSPLTLLLYKVHFLLSLTCFFVFLFARSQKQHSTNELVSK